MGIVQSFDRQRRNAKATINAAEIRVATDSHLQLNKHIKENGRKYCKKNRKMQLWRKPKKQLKTKI